jgi:hypothetical protein
MNEQQVKDILFISIIHMVKASRADLERLQKYAIEKWGAFYHICPGYWESGTQMEINAAVANINYCQEKLNETICLN